MINWEDIINIRVDHNIRTVTVNLALSGLVENEIYNELEIILAKSMSIVNETDKFVQFCMSELAAKYQDCDTISDLIATLEYKESVKNHES